ncbi:GGDEF domain-containing protein [Ectothiorhodospira lacustris]|uniref:GGDEF domain-containing protein n=1 Tax=Ectothiorhodospira lacustris TaxID=2899127 RepID=UPI001EE7887A|nr:GGDEF domain-containing protein [Ectothiorhodospira lacustris]MCG5502000.1 GGDEF domain-containing protein [Ectothiorhodospira lacustris]MCG5509523.1 GGDEF domain-containing protein [Ectothiorhodospira lacustris]MCG5521682.1 GGDEF domain-containing protein [Ectothiorhodospira lacustris]
MKSPDLFDAEIRVLESARQAMESRDVEAHRAALDGLIREFDRVIRDMRRLINHADRTERELNRANRRLTELTRSLAYRNRHDGLTGLLNRETLIDEAEALLAVQGIALILLDIDHFKQVNDRYGHPVGDRILKDVAGAMRIQAPENGLCGRLGGEEFAVILPGQIGGKALGCAGCIADAIRAVRREGHPGLRVTASFGIAFAAAGTSFDRLYICADDALYRAKHSGRDRIEVVGDCITQS